MSTTEALGWAAVVASTSIGLPQLIRLFRIRNTAGMSLLTWQVILANNVSWLSHGIIIRAPNMITMNSICLLQTTAIMTVIIRHRQLRAVPTVLPSALIILAMVGTDLNFGSASFGMVAIVAVLVANGGQSVRLVRSASVKGVAPGYLIATLMAAMLWLSWAFAVHEPGTMVQTIAGGTVALFNLVWWSLRRLGVARPPASRRTDNRYRLGPAD